MFCNTIARKSKRTMMQDTCAESGAMIARNTLDYVRDGARYVRFHNTDILRQKGDTIQIDTGGFNTVTTRARLNLVLRPIGASVSTSRGVLYLHHAGASHPLRERAVIKGDSVHTDGGTVDKDRALLDAFMRHVRAVGLPKPEESKGDPWVLSPGKVGDAVMRDWLQSRYWTLAFFRLAHEYAGTTQIGIGYYANNIWRSGKMDELSLRRVRRYARACMGYAA